MTLMLLQMPWVEGAAVTDGDGGAAAEQPPGAEGALLSWAHTRLNEFYDDFTFQTMCEQLNSMGALEEA